jgi:hypothetical protein
VVIVFALMQSVKQVACFRPCLWNHFLKVFDHSVDLALFYFPGNDEVEGWVSHFKKYFVGLFYSYLFFQSHASLEIQVTHLL